MDNLNMQSVSDITGSSRATSGRQKNVPPWSAVMDEQNSVSSSQDHWPVRQYMVLEAKLTCIAVHTRDVKAKAVFE